MVRYMMRPDVRADRDAARRARHSIRSSAGNVQTAGNVIIITDYASQVRDMMSLAKSLDVPGNNDGIYTIPVKHADATQLAQKLNEILGVDGRCGRRRRRRGARWRQGRRPGRYRRRQWRRRRAVEDPRRRPHEHADRRLERGRLPARQGARRSPRHRRSTPRAAASIRVYPLENALAEELATTLNDVVSGQQPRRARRRRAASGAPRAGTAGSSAARSRARSASSATSRRTR